MIISVYIFRMFCIRGAVYFMLIYALECNSLAQGSLGWSTIMLFYCY
jgi:hypothetical protein